LLRYEPSKITNLAIHILNPGAYVAKKTWIIVHCMSSSYKLPRKHCCTEKVLATARAICSATTNQQVPVELLRWTCVWPQWQWCSSVTTDETHEVDGERNVEAVDVVGEEEERVVVTLPQPRAPAAPSSRLPRSPSTTHARCRPQRSPWWRLDNGRGVPPRQRQAAAR
jgi:hypothetical protein